MRKKRPIVKSKAYVRSRYEAGQAAKKKKAAKKAAKKSPVKKAPAKKKPAVSVIDTSKPASAADKKVIKESRKSPSKSPRKSPAKSPTKTNDNRKKVESILTDPTKTQGQKYLARIRLGLMKDSSKRNVGRRSGLTPQRKKNP